MSGKADKMNERRMAERLKTYFQPVNTTVKGYRRGMCEGQLHYRCGSAELWLLEQRDNPPIFSANL